MKLIIEIKKDFKEILPLIITENSNMYVQIFNNTIGKKEEKNTILLHFIELKIEKSFVSTTVKSVCFIRTTTKYHVATSNTLS